MGNPYPAAFIDQNSEGRLVGEVNFTDPANQPGGGSSVIGRQTLVGNVVAIAQGDGPVELTWNTSQGPDTLLDLTNPAEPAVLSDGLYNVAAEISGAALAVGAQFTADLNFDYYSPSLTPDLGQTSPPAAAAPGGVPVPLIIVSGCWYLSAGGVIVITVESTDVTSRNFRISPVVVTRIPATVA